MGHTHLDLHGLLQLRDALDSVSLLDAQMELSLQSHSEVLISWAPAWVERDDRSEG